MWGRCHALDPCLPAELRTLWEGMAREQEEADRSEAERLKRLASELYEFNRLKQTQMSEKDRVERCGGVTARGRADSHPTQPLDEMPVFNVATKCERITPLSPAIVFL